MASLAPQTQKLMHALMRQGLGEEQAQRKAQLTLKSMPVLKTKAGLPAYMEIINVLNQNSRFDTVTQAPKAAKAGPPATPKRGPERTVSIGTPSIHYEVVTTLPPELVNDLLVQT